MSDPQRPADFAYASSDQFTHRNWMGNVPIIDALTLGELVLPGAHNAGMDLDAWYLPGLVSNWVACQNNSFLDQLNNGARALDLRIVQLPGDNCLFQHNSIFSSRALSSLIEAVNEFLSANPDEFIVLDFHEMRASVSDFDAAEFSRVMSAGLGERMIPARNNHRTLGQLKKASAVQRLMVSTEVDIDGEGFNPKVQHEWSGIAVTTPDELHRFISGVMLSPPRKRLPWSLSATCYAVLGGPVDIQEKLNEWFDPARTDWASKCSIINADFFEESKLVQYCRTANVVKAWSKVNTTTQYDHSN